MKKVKPGIRRATIIMIIAVLVMSLLALGACSKKEPEPEPEEEVVPEEPEKEEEPVVEEGVPKTINYFTGEKLPEPKEPTRPVAIVVENTYDARPQWGMDDAEFAPDIILQGEVEGGITRTLWFYADYTKLPGQVGPLRSARPPYIRFSQLFDATFIHWGYSHSKGNYVGADTVFREEMVDHIDSGEYDGLYGRDDTRDVAIEHRGIMYGDVLPDAIRDMGMRVPFNMDKFTILKFNASPVEAGDKSAKSVSLTFSDITETVTWTYSDADKKYKTDAFLNDVARDNILILMDDTEYVVKDDYGGSGSSLAYCDYLFSGGSGVYASLGKSMDITWKREGSKLVLTDASGQPLLLNPGKTWIGWGSANNGGSYEIG